MSLIKYKKSSNNIRLYRGLEKKFNPKHDLTTTDAPAGYSTWTDNKDLAKQYAGENGYIYYMDLPKRELKKEYIDEDGERALFFDNKKPAGLNGIKGKEFLVYTGHDLYTNTAIKELT